MAVNVVGLFDTHLQAERVVRQLLAAGIDSQAISVVASEPGGNVVRQTVDESGNMAGEGVVTGAASGLIVGALLGLLAGATVLALPPAGFLVAGPIAGLITGAGLGMVSGGLLGALIGYEIPEEHAHYYAESVRRGGTLVTASVDEIDRLRVEQIFQMAGAVDIAERGLYYRQNGFVAYDPHRPLFTPAEVAAERARFTDENGPIDPVAELDLDRSYREDFALSGIVAPYEQFRPAYQFGHDLATRPEYQGREWFDLQPQAKEIWEHRNPGSWDHFSQAILAGWNLSSVPLRAPRATMI